MLNHEEFVNAKDEWLIPSEFAFTRAQFPTMHTMNLNLFNIIKSSR
ncbi:hypothetical protein HMPREF9370_1744 [Neisseria wadsworthii 9715]|uniref:Uncharacterized protein n=1 Tax=Neisseria wadsworthii 9715 TaxID=1030841 RepID=G4CRN4_9NEIS|nr:hypothetical protein HMPREF9370_1744 [Neisseria wadsworthii 9715]